MSLETRVRIEIVKVEFLPKKPELRITYVVNLTTGSFEGVIGGGETPFTNDSEVSALTELVDRIQLQIERDLGIEPSTSTQTTDEEDAL